MADYYVRATGGSDGNSGLTFALGWATIPYAITNTTSNDRVFLCSDVSNKFSISTAINNWPYSREWYGADLVDGSPYNGAGRAYIIASVPMSNMCSSAYHSNMLYQDIDFDANSQGSVAFAFPTWTSTMRNNAFVNCSFHGGTADGISLTCTASTANRMHPIYFYDCEIYDNARYGVYNVVSGSVIFNNCAIHHNDSYNYFGTGSSNVIITFETCRIFRSATSSGINLVGNTAMTLINSVIYDNFSHGLEFTTETFRGNIRNSIFANNGGYGITAVSGLNSPWYYGDYNCYYSNTSGAVGTTINGGTAPGTHNITSDPQFTTTTNNSEDFTLLSGSPCLDVGIGFAGGQ
tara:strand:+ start:16956 stop:18002 length:1047 start_codon:yes stop_codon:yes gene_type:complete